MMTEPLENPISIPALSALSFKIQLGNGRQGIYILFLLPFSPTHCVVVCPSQRFFISP